MQIQANPWSFTPADQAVTTPIASITNQVRSALVTTTAAHGLAQGSIISVQGLTTVRRYRGGYTVLSVPSPTTFLINGDYKFVGLPNSVGEGNVLTAVYLAMIRAEQILWDCPDTLGVAPPTDLGALTLTDVAGNQVFSAGAASVPSRPYTYGKLYWINGLVINRFIGPGSTLQITIN